jgi:CBS domain containing-hemolysin-like protein
MDDSGAGGPLLFALLIFLDIVVYGFGSALHHLHPEGVSADAQGEKDSRKETTDPVSEAKSQRRDKMIRRILADQSDYTDTVQIVTVAVSYIYGAAYALSLTKDVAALLLRISGGAFSDALTILSAVLSFLVLIAVVNIIGIQMPRRLAAANPEKWIDSCGRFFYPILLLCLPMAHVTGWISTRILYLFGVRGTGLKGDVTEEEIRSIVHEGHEQGVIQQTEAEMIANIFEFSDKEAENIMTPRNDMIAIDGSTPLGDAVRFMLQQHNSRFPVYADNIDNIRGIVHMRDAVKYKEEHPGEVTKPIGRISEILREAIVVPETKSIDDLFRQMQKKKAQMVIVIDEYGQTSGLIAMEDILEEIVGNIMDEYDVDETHITPTGNKNEFIIDGRTPLEELTERFGLHFDDRYETLNGFMMSEMDRVPEPNDHFVTEYQGYRFKLLSVKDRQVQRVLLTRLQ